MPPQISISPQETEIRETIAQKLNAQQEGHGAHDLDLGIRPFALRQDYRLALLEVLQELEKSSQNPNVKLAALRARAQYFPLA